jgi:RNA polymerase Rpb2, domain 6/RNA polymerase Rpb2, domain 7
MLYSQQDMPFSSTGICPDIIMNPHAIPSRMTIGQLMECIMGKACCLEGGWGDATPFKEISVHDIAEILQRHGLEKHGNEVLYNPRTGEQIPCAIFMGPTYYQRLKHMVDDKIHCLTGDHEVLTSHGWKPIATVGMDDEVATLKDGEHLVYAKPTQLFAYPNYKGSLYRIVGPSIDLRVTTKHRMYVDVGNTGKYQLMEVVELFKEHANKRAVRYKCDAVWGEKKDMDNEKQEETATDGGSERRSQGIINNDITGFLTIFGAWIISSTLPLPPDGLHGPAFRIPAGEGQYAPQVNNFLSEVFRTMGLPASHDPVTGTFTALHRTIGAYLNNLRDMWGSPDKWRLPDWVFRLSAHQSRTLLASMIIWSSHVVTASKLLADDIMRLALHAGTSASVSVVPPPTATTLYRVVVAMSDLQSRPSACGKEVFHCIEPFKGAVYCLSVPGEVFYVRRNGKPCWTGNSRANNGPVVLLTRQPAEGRARDGGLRLGEMEVECNFAHGIMHFLKERFMECSDNYRVFTCRKCGMISTVNPEKNIYSCASCKNITSFTEIRIPYASKLLFQEVQTMGIAAKFLTDR